MTKIFLSILLLINLSVYSQTAYDVIQNSRIYELEKLTRYYGTQIKTVNSKDSIKDVQINSLKVRAYSLEQHNALQEKQLRFLTVRDSLKNISITNLTVKLSSLTNRFTRDSIFQWGQIKNATALIPQVAILKKDVTKLQSQITIVNTLAGVGAVRITKVPGTLTYNLLFDSTRFQAGSFTLFNKGRIDNLMTRMAAVERFNQKQHGNINTSGQPVSFPDKSKVIIYIKE